VTICYRWVRRNWLLEEDQEPLLERVGLGHQRASMDVEFGRFEADVIYIWSDYLFLNSGAEKEAMFAATVVWRVRSSGSRLRWLLWTSSCLITRQFLKSKTSCVSANLWRANSFLSYMVLCDLCFKVFLRYVDEVWRFHFDFLFL
jgi:hypothetical protein